VADGAVYFGGGDGVLYAVGLEDGAELWRYATRGRIRSSPAVADGVVYVGSMDGTMHAVDTRTGERVWQYETEGAGLSSAAFGFDRQSVQSSPAVVGGRVVFGARDGFMYALNATDGSLLWRFDHQVSWCITSPAIADGVVYAGSSDGLFAHAVDVATGEELWRTPTGHRVFASLAVSGQTVLVANHAGLVLALDRTTGEEQWRFRTEGPVQSSPVPWRGVVFVGSDDGFLYALQGTEGPSLHRAVFWDPEATQLYQGHEELKDYLVPAGYTVLDAEALAGFMSARVGDGEPSVVVFATDDVPASVAPVAADTVLYRRYLDAGGRVVSIGYSPMAIAWDPETGGLVDIDWSRPAALLSVDHSSVSGDEYSAFATEEGSAWGLPDHWIDILAVDPEGVSTVLAADERGRATSWIRRYTDAPGGGFVKVRGHLLALGNPAIVQRLAEYGFR
jgi:outer membrane protein assembly factor BamB